jgi:membrane protease YdiL (CAAX protease family)
VSVEEIRPEPPIRRNYVGWVVLFLLFGFAALNSILSSVKPKGPTKASYLIENATLKTLTSARRAFDVMPATAKDKEERLKQLQEGLDDHISNLVTAAEKDPSAARIYAVMRTEQGKDVPEKMLEVLRRSKDPLDQAYLEIYGKSKLTRERAQELSLQLPDRPFSNELAAIHALEKGGSTSARERLSPWVAARQALLSFLLFGTMFTGMVLWGVYLVGRRRGRFEPKGHPVGRVTLADADHLAIRAALIFGGYFIIAGGLSAARLSPAAAALAGGLSIVALCILLSFIPIGGKRLTLGMLGIGKERFGKNLLWGFAGFFAEVPVTLMMAGLGTTLFRNLPPPSHPATEMVSNANGILAVLPILFVASITAPIWEEILFRGLLFPALSRVAGSLVVGAISSSLLFAVIHPQGPILVFALAGLATVSCALAYQTRSLVPSIVLHMVHNTAVMVAAILTL